MPSCLLTYCALVGMCKNRAQIAQNQWLGGGARFHISHKRFSKPIMPPNYFPIFLQVFTHRLSQTVHNISAFLTDVVWRFSAEYTGPTTTITTFIYKNIEKEAA